MSFSKLCYELIYDVLTSKRKLCLYSTEPSAAFNSGFQMLDMAHPPWINFANMSFPRLSNNNAISFSSSMQRQRLMQPH